MKKRYYIGLALLALIIISILLAPKVFNKLNKKFHIVDPVQTTSSWIPNKSITKLQSKLANGKGVVETGLIKDIFPSECTSECDLKDLSQFWEFDGKGQNIDFGLLNGKYVTRWGRVVPGSLDLRERQVAGGVSMNGDFKEMCGDDTPCKVENMAQFMNYFSQDKANPFYNVLVITGYGKYWYLADPIGSGLFKDYPDTYKQFPDAHKFNGNGDRIIITNGELKDAKDPFFSKVCTALKDQDPDCNLTVVSDFQGYDSSDPVAWVIGGGQLFVLNYQNGQPNILSQVAVESRPEFAEICKYKPEADSYCKIDVASHYKSFDTLNVKDSMYNVGFFSAYGHYIVTSAIQ